jgi:CHAT domain-containing protein
VAVALGCSRPRTATKASIAEVEYAGCKEVIFPGPVCQLDSRKDSVRELRLHPPIAGSDFEVSSDGRQTEISTSSEDGARSLAVRVPAHASSIELFWNGATGPRVWRLRIADREPAPDWLDQAYRELRNGGAGARAQAKKDLDVGIPRAGAPLRARAAIVRAKSECEDSGTSEACLRLLRAAIVARRAAGQIQGEADDATVLAQYLIKANRFTEAQEVLADLKLPEGAPAEARFNVAYRRGLLARKSGDHRTALGELQIAAHAARWFDRSMWLQTEEERALQLNQLGRFDEANAVFRMLLPAAREVLSACDLADLFTNQGWALASANDAGAPLGDPTPLFAQAREIFSRSNCPAALERRFNAELNLALAYLQQDRRYLPRAGAALRDAEPLLGAANPRDRLWWLNLSGRLALAENRPEAARAQFERLESLASALFSHEELWRAAYGKARALVGLGRLGEAVTTLQIAEGLVDRQLAGIPLDAGKESFADQWEVGTRLLVDLLLQLGRPAEALRAARIARARVLRELAVTQRLASLSAGERQRRDAALEGYWRMRDEIDREAAADMQRTEAELAQTREARSRQYRDSLAILDRELATVSVPGAANALSHLPPPRRGELILAYFPLSEPGSWVGFADDGVQVTYDRFNLPADEPRAVARRALSSMLLEPFGRQIRKAQRLRLLPYGKLRIVPFHALPFDGDPLLAAKPVAYGLDLAMPPPAHRNRQLRALVVYDPQGNLEEARKEGPDVQGGLDRSGGGWQVGTLSGPKATETAFRTALQRGIDLLHYAGHADFSGRGGWESQLPLAAGTRLSPGDIVSLNPAPTWVILSGCETGKTDETTQVESQGLAQAFLLAGAQGVIAATHKVDDASAHRLMNALYRQVKGAPLDLAVLWQRAASEARQGVQASEWESFRVFVP